jgi:hypothetical protein
VLRDHLAPGSLLVLSHGSVDRGPATVQQGADLSDVYRRGGSTLVLRSEERITRFFDGFALVDPGVVPLPEWRPDGPPDEEDPVVYAGFAGVGRIA